jgi:hypothetical protein
VAGGKLGKDNSTDGIEIVDLSLTGPDCLSFPRLPFKTAFAKGMLTRGQCYKTFYGRKFFVIS